MGVYFCCRVTCVSQFIRCITIIFCHTIFSRSPFAMRLPNRWPTAAEASSRQICAMDTFRSDRSMYYRAIEQCLAQLLWLCNSIVFMHAIGRNLSQPSAWTTGAMANNKNKFDWKDPMDGKNEYKKIRTGFRRKIMQNDKFEWILKMKHVHTRWPFRHGSALHWW